MATLIAVISILSGAASIAGLVIQIFGRTSKDRVRISIALMLPALFVCGYIFVVPDTEVVRRVDLKIRYFSRQLQGDTLVQEGNFSFYGTKVYAIQFPEPFRETPQVSILNVNGYAELEVPRVHRVTPLFFEVRRWGISGSELVPTLFQQYRWIAEGAAHRQPN